MDNYFQSYPAKMSDAGRLFTDYATPTRRDEHIKQVNGVYRDDEYRLMLQENGVKIMQSNFENAKKNHNLPKVCLHQYPTRISTEQMAQQMANYNAVRMGQPVLGLECTVMEDLKASNY